MNQKYKKCMEKGKKWKMLQQEEHMQNLHTHWLSVVSLKKQINDTSGGRKWHKSVARKIDVI